MQNATPAGFFRFENTRTRAGMSGFGDGEYVRLRDEQGTVWNGTADQQDDNLVRYQLRDKNGRMITGISDTYGIILRDEKGNNWRGFLE